MSDIINLLPDDSLIIIIYKSNNCMCKFVCKRWNKICLNLNNYSPQKNKIQILNSNGKAHKKFILDNFVITSIDQFNTTSEQIYGLVRYDEEHFNIQTPFFEISELCILSNFSDSAGILEFQLNNNCHNLKHFFNMIDKKMINNKEIIFSSTLFKNYDNTDFLKNYKIYEMVYEPIIKKDSFNDYYWTCMINLSKDDIPIWRIEENNSPIRIHVQSLDRLSECIPPRSSIKFILEFNKFYANKIPINNILSYGISLGIKQIGFIPAKK